MKLLITVIRKLLLALVRKVILCPQLNTMQAFKFFNHQKLHPATIRCLWSIEGFNLWSLHDWIFSWLVCSAAQILCNGQMQFIAPISYWIPS